MLRKRATKGSEITFFKEEELISRIVKAFASTKAIKNIVNRAKII
jgi:hypothetical protein